MIKLANVTKIYPGSSYPALHQINFAVERGGWAFVLGPTGSGKSTLLQLLYGELAPSIGSVEVNGKDLATMPLWKRPHFRRAIGYVSQNPVLIPYFTAYENVAFALQVIGKTAHVARRVVPELLELVMLGGKEHRYAGELTDGERQRLAIARSLANRPLILLADEPTSALDSNASIEMLRLLDRINRTGSTVVMSTADPRMPGMMRRPVIELERGSLVRDDEVSSPAN